MPTKIRLLDHSLKGYTEHGVVFQDRNVGTQVVGTCPWCHKEKLYVKLDGEVWDCKVCGKSGNFSRFLQYRVEDYRVDFQGLVVAQLCKDRGLRIESLKAFGLGWSTAGSFYSVPVGWPCTDIMRYRIGGKGLNTSGGKVSLMFPLEQKAASKAWLTEGVWDGMALYECFGKLGIKDEVYASPGANVFPGRASEIFHNKEVTTVFDNDLAGIRGMQRVRNLLTGQASKLFFIHWSADTAEGYDVRDLYHDQDVKAYQFIKTNLQEHPPSIPDAQPPAFAEKPSESVQGAGLPEAQVTSGFRHWLKIPNTEILEVVFGTIFANRINCDPVWLFLVGPPGSMKTEMIMTLTEAPLIYAMSTLTPRTLISGANFAHQGDPSVIPKLNGKVLAIKDFTPVLSLHQGDREEIFSTLRDAYDGECAKPFGNGVYRRYKSRFGILAGVTPIIEQYGGNSVLGERFLKYRVPTENPDDAIRKAVANIAKETGMRADLRGYARQTLDKVIGGLPQVPLAVAEKIVRLAKWIAMLRGVIVRDRYTQAVIQKPVQEIGTRLAKQLTGLGLGISIYRGHDAIREATYKTLVHVARDTIPDRNEEVVKQLYSKCGEEAADLADLAEWTRFPTGTVMSMMEDLCLLNVIVRHGQRSWRLCDSVLKTMDGLELYS